MQIDLPAEPKRILIVKPSALGDIVHTLPFLYLLRQRFPNAHIAWLVVPAFASLLEGHPLLNDVIRFDRRGIANWWRDLAAASKLLKFSTDLRRQRFDLVIDLQGLLRSGWIAWQTRAPVRVGFDYAREGGAHFYTHRVPTRTHEKHATERYLDIAEALGCGRGPIVFDFGVERIDRLAAADLTGQSEKYAVLLPGTNWATKRWPEEYFAQLVQPLREEFGLDVFIAGANDVAPIRFEGATNLAGRTTLRQLAALLDRASLVFANDSGPMHVAAALGRPLVAIYGPTNPVRTGPYLREDAVLQLDLPCRPCYSRTCVHQSCMRWLTPADVLRAARQQMADFSADKADRRR